MKTILITGASNGIGRALTEHFIKDNWRVYATDNDVTPLSNIESPNLKVVKLDVREATAWTEVLSQINHLDVIINNAGVVVPSFVTDINLQEADLQIDVNFKGVVNGSTLAAQKMVQQQSGHIINIASLAGIAPIHGLPVYAATKAAVRSFSLSIIPELREKNVNVTVICPDLVSTNMLTKQLDYAAAAMTFSGGKILSTADVIRAVVNNALRDRQIEVMIPKTRGWLGKIGNVFPTIAGLLTKMLAKKGRKKLVELKASNNF